MPVYEYNDALPEIAGDSWLAPSADIIGDVRLGSRVTIWFRAVVRADNARIEIGEGSNIQDGAMLHADPGAPLMVGRNVTVGHHAILHGCTIEDQVLVGMGATILNGAVIGAGSLVAAGALVTEGKIFEPGSLIMGSPAKVVRKVSQDQALVITNSAADYSAKGDVYRMHLHAISS